MEQNKPIKGLGDRVEDAIKKTGLDKVAKAYTKATGKDCGCNKRKQQLNKWFPGSIHPNVRKYTKDISIIDIPNQPRRDIWFEVKGLNNPVVQNFIQKTKTLDWGEYNLGLVGGVLHDWFTRDIDCVITGPYNPQKIHKLQFDLITIGFNVGLYVDVVYTDEIRDTVHEHNRWLRGEDVKVQKMYYSYDKVKVNGVIYDFSGNKEIKQKDGFWILDRYSGGLADRKFVKKLKKRDYKHNYLKII